MGITHILDNSTIDSYRKYIPYDLAPLLEEETTVVFGIYNEEPAGVAIIEENDGCSLRYIFIEEDLRQSGIGTQAVREILFCMHFCMQRQLKVRIVPRRNPELYSILMEYSPAVEHSETGYLDFTAGAVKAAKRLQMSTKNVIPLKNCLDRELTALKNLFESKHIKYMPADFRDEDYDEEVSCVYMENNKAVAVLLAKKDTNRICVDYMASLAVDKTAIIKMMAYGISKISELYGDDYDIHAAVVNENLTTILEIVLEVDIDRQETLIIDLSFIDHMLLEEV